MEEADRKSIEDFILRLLELAKERDPDLGAVVYELVIEAARGVTGFNLEGIDKTH